MKMQSKLKLATAPVALGVALAATPAMAQDADEATADEAVGAPIVVTGSRIVRPEVESISPVTTVGAELIDETGTVRVEDLLNDLPQTVAGQTAFVSNGASGTATVNLRNLGSTRTLVLIDGRRMPSGDPFATAPDLNQIPAQLVERIELVTGGASSTYGADAVAGVVNFIMDRDYEGFSLESQVSFYNASNGNDSIQDLLRRTNNPVPNDSQNAGFTYDITATFGAGFDDGRGHVTGYLGYREIDAIVQANYDESACALSFRSSDPTGFTCAGSSTTPNGTFFVFSPGANGLTGSNVLTLDENGPGNTFRDSLAFSGTGADTYNYAPTNYYQRPDKRWTAGFFADYEINESLNPYAEFQFMDDRSVAQIAFSGTFFNGPNTLSCGNNLLSDQQRTALGCSGPTDSVGILIGKRLVEGAPRQNDLRHTSYRGVLGMRGDLWDDWSYDVYALRGNTIYQNTYLNDLSVSRINAAISGCPGTGEPAGCIPLNVFQIGGVTRAQFDYIAVPALQNADLETTVASGYITGPIGDWFGAGDIQVVFGTEYRREDYELRVDENFAQGNLSGQGGPTAPVAGSFNVKEFFTEIDIPLVDGGFIDYLGLLGGFRYSDYNTSGGSETYKVGVNFAPVDWVKFRAVYSRAVRSPNITSLFSPQNIGLFGGTDPCATATPTATAAQCANTGVTAAQYGNIPANPAGQYNQLGGGNPGLLPEVADSYTGGVVITGDALGLRGFALTVDYFNISVEGTIGGVGAQTAIDNCIATGDPAFCSLINRNAGTGDLWLGSDANDGFVVNTVQNIGSLETEGIDITAAFNYPLGNGALTFNYAGVYTFNNRFQPLPGEPFIDCAGFFGSTCGSPQPEYGHVARVGYRADSGTSFTFSWRYTGGVEGDVAVTGDDQFDTIDSYSYFDLSGSTTVADTLTLTAGVNNIFDKKPPLIGSAYSPSNGNTYPGIYDPVGRQIFLRASLDF
ncbi:TonB-dependent receptor plug domain-containing protein [Qipengyuania sp. DSG2-2]|uniref:TonB-dependent receptor plug domain-containing protein n=1 Tax=Qipengyuania sp. DGS2-2 TaxID=3349631 RepID=UPI0036D39E17